MAAAARNRPFKPPRAVVINGPTVGMASSPPCAILKPTAAIRNLERSSSAINHAPAIPSRATITALYGMVTNAATTATMTPTSFTILSTPISNPLMVFPNGVVSATLLLFSEAPRAVYQVSVNIIFLIKSIDNEPYLN